MDTRKTTIYFQILAFLAIALLWGISLWNGTVKALLVSAWTGRLGEGGEPLRTTYTGFFVLDYPINLLVAFFYYGTSGHDEGYQLFLLDAYATLQSAFVWLYVESFREEIKTSKWVARPVIFGLLWQAFGAAISLPFYYSAHLRAAFQSPEGQNVVELNPARGHTQGFRASKAAHLAKAKALPFAFILGAIVPTIIGMAPTWSSHYNRDPSLHQSILFAWQPDPVWVSVILITLSWAITRLGPPREGPDDRKQAHRWINASYLLAFVSSSSGHFYVLYRILTASDPRTVNFVRMYVPFVNSGPSGTESNILVRGPWLFLQYDLIIISLSSLSWAFLLLVSLGPKIGLAVDARGGWQRVTLALSMLAMSVTFGPGAVVSLALLARQQILPDIDPKMQVSSRYRTRLAETKMSI